MNRKIFVLCIALILMVTCAQPVFADEFDRDRTGSISVTLIEPKQNQPIVGAELRLYRVATVVMDDAGKLIYDYTQEFAQFSTPLTDASLANDLDAFLPREGIPFRTMITDETGTALCEDLALGLYFVKQMGHVDGFSACTPFLVTLPGKSDDGYLYEVDASPKTEVERLTSITIKKRWNTDSATAPAKSVTVQLLRNGQLVKTATLNAQNNWQITYTDLPESDAYSIKEVNVPKGFVASYTQSGYVFTVTNSTTLIQTGQLIWPIPALAVSGMLLLALGFVVLQKKRKAHA